MNGVVAVAALHHLAVVVQPGQSGAVFDADGDVEEWPILRRASIQYLEEAPTPLPRQRRDGHRRDVAARHPVDQDAPVFRGQQVDLVEGLDDTALGGLFKAEIAQHPLHVFLLGVAVGVRGIAHVDDDVGLAHLLQGCLEGGHQLVRQVRNKSHRIGQDGGAPRGQVEAAHGRIEGGEQLVLGLVLGLGQGIEQGRLAGIGVAHQGDHRKGDTAPRRAV